ncbi:unnamed protein product [Linum trigynum]|uniref:Uncharacterized protein n=1 Tax=Linum trigynum TaxID=586398 RepID=A0AAV2CZM0_9ROSI
MEAFADCIGNIELHDLGFSGYQFMWEKNKQGGGFIEERLDCFLASIRWGDRFKEARMRHMDKRRSEHRPIIGKTCGDEDEEPKWGWNFRFDPFWTNHAECAGVIKEAWNEESGVDVVSKINTVGQN